MPLVAILNLIACFVLADPLPGSFQEKIRGHRNRIINELVSLPRRHPLSGIGRGHNMFGADLASGKRGGHKWHRRQLRSGVGDLFGLACRAVGQITRDGGCVGSVVAEGVDGCGVGQAALF